jgi:hypothetical protein
VFALNKKGKLPFLFSFILPPNYIGGTYANVYATKNNSVRFDGGQVFVSMKL